MVDFCLFGSIVIGALEVSGITSTTPVLVLLLVIKIYSAIRAQLNKNYPEEILGAPVQYR